MYSKKIITCHPIKGDLKKKFGEGYYYGVTIKRNNYGDKDDERTDWFVYQNGTFSSTSDCYYSYQPSEHYSSGGTFDSSKYNDYVQQMKEFKEDWQEELEYDEKLSFDSVEFERKLRRRLIQREGLYDSLIDSSELPF